MFLLTMSQNVFIMCLSNFLEEDFLSRLIAAHEFSLLAVETNDKGAVKVAGNNGVGVGNLDSTTEIRPVGIYQDCNKDFITWYLMPNTLICYGRAIGIKYHSHAFIINRCSGSCQSFFFGTCEHVT